MQEIWRDIEGYEGLYQVSNKRRVKSLNYNKSGKEGILKPRKSKDGYLQLQLHKEGECKDYRVHRLVGQTFLENLEGLPEINHKDEDKTNNCVENLEWCSSEYNKNYGTRNKRVSKSLSKPLMCVEINEIFNSAQEAQEQTGIDASSIGKCANHRKYFHTARRLHWQYI